MRLHRMVGSSAGMRKVHWAVLALTVAQFGFFPSLSTAQATTPPDAPTGAVGSSPEAFCVGYGVSSARPLDGLNHLQYGLDNMDRYYKRSPKYPPKFWLQEAIGDFSYVIGHNPGSNHPLLADVHVHRAVALTLSGGDAAARQDYVRAIQLNPNLSKAYLGLARSYAQTGLKSEALDTVTQGLRCLPSNKLLQQDYVKYGGKLPYPAPVARAQKPEPSAAGNEKRIPEPSPTERSEGDSVRPDSADKAASNPGQDGTQVPATESGAGKGQSGEGVVERGCRFCPPEEIQQKWRESFGQKSSQ